MDDLMENFEINPISVEREEKERDLFKNSESELRDHKHLEMAHEWLIGNRNGGGLHLRDYFRGCESYEPKESVIRNFQHLEMVYEWLRSHGKILPLILKRRIWWEPVPKAIGYVVYVSQDRSIFYQENFRWEATDGIVYKVVNGKTELFLLDGWLEFPKETGTYYIGITSRDELGNESDPFILEGFFNFIPPARPSKGGIEYL